MSITQRILLRHRSEGHLRFEIPKELLEAGVGEQLTEALNGQLGVYRVTAFPRQGKLSIRYFPGMTDVRTIALFLSEQATLLEQWLTGNVQASATEMALSDRLPGSDWIDRAVQEAQETLNATGIVFRRLLGESEHGGPPKLMLEFFTDLLVLWLIKTHWHLIIQHWLKRPWTFRYEWSASLYLIFLLVRSKKTKN